MATVIEKLMSHKNITVIATVTWCKLHKQHISCGLKVFILHL